MSRYSAYQGPGFARTAVNVVRCLRKALRDVETCVSRFAIDVAKRLHHLVTFFIYNVFIECFKFLLFFEHF